MKKIFCIILTAILALSCMPFATAQDVQTRLYTTYGDGMLFQQNTDAILSGEAESGSVITATLMNADNEIVASGESAAKADGTFTVSFTAPSGGYDEYTVVLMQNGKAFDSLENVFFR